MGQTGKRGGTPRMTTVESKTTNDE